MARQYVSVTLETVITPEHAGFMTLHRVERSSDRPDTEYQSFLVDRQTANEFLACFVHAKTLFADWELVSIVALVNDGHTWQEVWMMRENNSND